MFNYSNKVNKSIGYLINIILLITELGSIIIDIIFFNLAVTNQ